jgi:hypothetical protein
MKTALAPCPACNERISFKAKKCARCGEPDPFANQRKSSRNKVLFSFALLILAGVIFSNFFYSNFDSLSKSQIIQKLLKNK